MSYNPQNPNGQATSANSAPVVIASDQSAVPISASSLPLPTTAATSTKQSDGSQKTQVVDGSGNVIGSTSNALDVNIKSGSSGTQYAEGATSATATGTLAMGKNGTTLKAVLTNSSGNLVVAGTGTFTVDGSGVTQPVSAASLPLPSGAATAAKQPALGTAGSPSSDVITVQGVTSMTALKVDGSGVTQPVSGTVSVTANSSVNVNQVGGTAIDTNSGTKSAGTQRVVIATDQPQLTNALKVDGSAVTQPVSGTITANAGTNLNTSALALESGGNLATLAGGVTSSKYQVNVSQIAGGTAINSGVTGALATGGDTANGSSDAGNPNKIGGVGRTTNPTAVSDGQRVNATFDKLGKQVVVGSIRDLKGAQQTTITSSTAETTIVSAVASTFCDLYGLVLTNTSATTTKVTIKDSTAGTTRFVFEVPPTETRGFMLPESAAHNQATVNNNWTATCGTSVASLEVTALFVKNT